ncbi:hypothetical protein P7K49_031675 [Saguinus oedipus]|uniref:Uncharacterized protein n=1 Tax=Saguinus oedipus TaxID=9490 RepID=A0ABQ9U034_SAGOE|nr:hypothetical protein P7K49_031675 [Saguinus oedipus]
MKAGGFSPSVGVVKDDKCNEKHVRLMVSNRIRSAGDFEWSRWTSLHGSNLGNGGSTKHSPTPLELPPVSQHGRQLIPRTQAAGQVSAEL